MRVIKTAVLNMETLEWVSVDSFEYEGPVALCCGSDGAEQTAQDQSQSFAKTLSGSYSTLMDQSSAAFQSTQNMLNRFNAGIMNPGLSPQALASQESAAIAQAGATSRNVRQQLGNLSGGTTSSGILSGVEAQLGAAADTGAANQLATAQEGIANENAKLAQENTEFSINSEAKQAGALGSLATGQAAPAISSNNAAFSQAQTINQQNQQFAQTLGSLAVSGIENFGIPGLQSLLPGSPAGINPATTGLGPAIGAMQPSTYSPPGGLQELAEPQPFLPSTPQ
jgi:hypothetical protein